MKGVRKGVLLQPDAVHFVDVIHEHLLLWLMRERQQSGLNFQCDTLSKFPGILEKFDGWQLN